MQTTMIAVTTFTLAGLALLWSQMLYVAVLIETCRWHVDPILGFCTR